MKANPSACAEESSAPTLNVTLTHQCNNSRCLYSADRNAPPRLNSLHRDIAGKCRTAHSQIQNHLQVSCDKRRKETQKATE